MLGANTKGTKKGSKVVHPPPPPEAGLYKLHAVEFHSLKAPGLNRG
jgi:hypothetical protein